MIDAYLFSSESAHIQALSAFLSVILVPPVMASNVLGQQRVANSIRRPQPTIDPPKSELSKRHGHRLVRVAPPPKSHIQERWFHPLARF